MAQNEVRLPGPGACRRISTEAGPILVGMTSVKRSSGEQISRLCPAKTPSSGRPSRTWGFVGLAVAGALLLSACEVDPETDDDGGAEGGEPAGSGDEEILQAPDPQGDQLSHQEMREVLSEHVSDARLTDTDNYMPGLRDVETELARLVVDPQDCKQYVAQSASPVPEGALVVFADNTAADGDSGEGPQDGSPAEDEDAQPESRGGGGFTFSADSMPLALPVENEEAEEPEDDADSDDEGSDDEDSVEADLPEDRQVTVYSFQDTLAAEAHFSNELEGVENCTTYTAVRSGPDDEEAETQSSITEVEVDSQAEEAVGMTRELSYDQTTEHSVIVMLRDGAQVVSLGVPVSDELDDEEAEAAVDELEDEAGSVLEDLLG